jgi:phage I-like protein
MRVQGSNAFSIILDESASTVPNQVQVLRTGKFNHPQYGKFDITTQVLSDMVQNFAANVRGVDLAFDYFHDSDKEAAAWVSQLYLTEDGQELWAVVEWTPTASQKLSDRELRYFSPDFAFKWTDPESGVSYNNVLFGGGLTNRPFVKEMKAIVANENKGENNMTEFEQLTKSVTELSANVLKLSEGQAAMQKQMALIPPPKAPLPPAPPAPADPTKKTPPPPSPKLSGAPDPSAGGQDGEPEDVNSLKAQIAALQAQLSKSNTDASAAMAEVSTLAERINRKEKEADFNVLLAEGKLIKAQKDAYMANDAKKLAELAMPLNPGKGDVGVDTGAEGFAEKNEKIVKLAEQKVKDNPKLAYSEAMSLAKREVIGISSRL